MRQHNEGSLASPHRKPLSKFRPGKAKRRSTRYVGTVDIGSLSWDERLRLLEALWESVVRHAGRGRGCMHSQDENDFVSCDRKVLEMVAFCTPSRRRLRWR